MTIGTRVKTLLKFKGMEQKELCRRTGISQTKMSRIVNNLAKPNVEELESIANYLNLTIFELLGYSTTFNELLEAYVEREIIA